MEPLKAGTYYIGDPSYVARNNRWLSFLNDVEYFSDNIHTIKGFRLAGGGTAYGDGTYKDQEGREYPVDTGLLSCIPMEYLLKHGKKPKSGDGQVVEFEEDFAVEVSGGIFRFGHILIDTKNDEEEEDEGWDEFDEEEEDEEEEK